MKFDFVIGNPPYQDETLGDNKGFAPPVYHKFLESAYEVSDHVTMIHPARFLFNAGSTPKQWNSKMLNDSHVKVLWFEQNSSKVFANTDIKGGVVVTYRDAKTNFGAIGTFTPYDELNNILKKVVSDVYFQSLSDIVVSGYSYHFLQKMYDDHPELMGRLSSGHDFDLKSNVLVKMPEVFEENEPSDGANYIQILGRNDDGRVFRFIKREYINDVKNLDKYKVITPKASGTGEFGEMMAPSIVGKPGVGNTETFLTIGFFETDYEAESCLKYIKTKFARALFGITKKTQNVAVDTWKYIPTQDFTSNSDIDWSKSVKEIDKQLYKKYGLDENEVEFIETHVKEME